MAPHLPKAQIPLAFSGTTYLFKDYLIDVSHVSRGQRDRENPTFWGCTVLSIPVLSCCKRTPLLFVLREDELWEVLKWQSVNVP